MTEPTLWPECDTCHARAKDRPVGKPCLFGYGHTCPGGKPLPTRPKRPYRGPAGGGEVERQFQWALVDAARKRAEEGREQ